MKRLTRYAGLIAGASLLTAGLGALAGCTMQGDVTDENRQRHITCKDTRDGEVFSFHGKTIRDVRVGIGADSCFTVTDDGGKVRTLCGNNEAWLKCSH